MDIATSLSWAAERYPNRRAVGGPHPMTYREWDARTNSLARALAGLGVRPRDRVAVLLEGGEPMASTHLALQKLGAATVPLSTRLAAPELAYCLQDSAPVLLVSDPTTADAAVGALAGLEDPPPRAHSGAEAPSGAASLDRLAAAAPDGALDVVPAEDDVSVMLYTSGTTGRPKGVPRTHAAEHTAAVAHLIQAQHRPGEVTLGVMPLFHTMGMRTLLASIVAAGTWVPQPRFAAERSLELIDAEGIGALYLVPTIYWELLRTGRLHEMTSVRRLAYAGAAMTPHLAEQLGEALQPAVFVNHYGSTEVYTFSIFPDVLAKPGCAGRAGIFGRIRLVEPEEGASPRDVVGPGAQGQVAVSLRGPEAFAGYWNRPDANARAIRDGWYFPGDLATEDGDGDLWVSGRVDDMINSGGENLYPEEIENALTRCPAVSAVTVAGLPDDKWGQVVTAFVVTAPRLDAGEALEHVAAYAREESGLPSLKRPKRFVAIPEIPTSAVGKILRRRLIGGEVPWLAELNLTAPQPAARQPPAPQSAAPQSAASPPALMQPADGNRA